MSQTTTTATYAQRIAFVCETASRLHTYGTTAQRLEGALIALSTRLGLECEPWSNPTGLILSFSDPSRALGASDTTRPNARVPALALAHRAVGRKRQPSIHSAIARGSKRRRWPHLM
jgi:hypothetical protein